MSPERTGKNRNTTEHIMISFSGICTARKQASVREASSLPISGHVASGTARALGSSTAAKKYTGVLESRLPVHESTAKTPVPANARAAHPSTKSIRTKAA